MFCCFSIIFICSSCDILNRLTCEHDYVDISRVESTCEKEGQIISECSLCGKKKKTIIDLASHDFYDIKVEATCQENGYYGRAS